MIQLPTEFKEFLRLLNRHDVEYLLIGGWAVGHYGYVRATGDIDFWVASTFVNAKKVIRALNDFGLQGDSVTTDLVTTVGQIIRFGLPPLRIEIVTEIDGVIFDECYCGREIRKIDAIEIPIIGLPDLLANKKASGRLKDLADFDELKELL